MIRVFTIITFLAATALAGCATDGVPKPVVEVTGPKFPASRFDCGSEPVPPNPVAVGNKGGSSAAVYENRLSAWGNGCKAKLNSVGSELGESGQVIY